MTIPLSEADVLSGCKALLNPLRLDGVLSYRRIYSGGIPLRRGKHFTLRPNPEMAGMTDLLVFLPQMRVIHAELKATGGCLRPEQRAWREEMTHLGHVFVLIRHPEELRRVLLEHGVRHWSL